MFEKQGCWSGPIFNIKFHKYVDHDHSRFSKCFVSCLHCTAQPTKHIQCLPKNKKKISKNKTKTNLTANYSLALYLFLLWPFFYLLRFIIINCKLVNIIWYARNRIYATRIDIVVCVCITDRCWYCLFDLNAFCVPHWLCLYCCEVLVSWHFGSWYDEYGPTLFLDFMQQIVNKQIRFFAVCGRQ